MVNVIDNHTDRLLLTGIESALHVAGHVLLQHGLDLTQVLLVLGVNRLGAEQTTFLCRVPVELDGVSSLTLDNRFGPQQGPKCLEDSHSSTAVIISAGRRQNRWQEQVDAILVCAQHNRVVSLARDAGDNTELTPRVIEALDRGTVLGGTGLLDDLADLGVKPLGRLDTVVRLVVAGVEGGEVLEVLLHVGLGQVGRQWADFLFVVHLAGVADDARGVEGTVGTGLEFIGDIDEVDTVL